MSVQVYTKTEVDALLAALGGGGSGGGSALNGVFQPRNFAPPNIPYNQGNDDTQAWQGAINAAKANHGVVLDEPGDKYISNFDITGCTGIAIIMPQGGSLIAVHQTSPRFVFDLTGSNDYHISGVRLRSREGPTSPPVLAMGAFLMAESTQGGDSDNNSLFKCGSAGPWSAAALAVIGAVQNDFHACSFQQDQIGQPCYIISRKPDYGVISAFKPIAQNASNANTQHFTNTRLHGHKGQNSGFTGYLRGAQGVIFDGGLHDCSGLAHIFFQDDCAGVTSIGQQFYSENGTPASHLFYTQYAHDHCEDLVLINPIEHHTPFSVSRTNGNFPRFRVIGGPNPV